MGMGDDIAAVYATVGISYTIIRPGGNITGEFLDYEDQREVRPFFIEHFLRVSLQYNTQTRPGDLIVFADGRKYLVAHWQPDVFQGAIYAINAVIYQTNVQISSYRPVATGTYDKTITWGSPINNSVDGLWVAKDVTAYGDSQKSPTQGLDYYSTNIYLPKSLDIIKHDRISIVGYSKGYAAAGVLNFTVEQWDDATYPGLSIYYCSEDARA